MAECIVMPVIRGSLPKVLIALALFAPVQAQVNVINGVTWQCVGPDGVISSHRDKENALECVLEQTISDPDNQYAAKPIGAVRLEFSKVFADSYFGADNSDATVPPNNPPAWGTIDCGFVEGTASSCALPVSDPDGDALTLTNETGCTLLSGTTLDSANRELDYDGVGADGSVSGCVFGADDGTAAVVNSEAFGYAIEAQGGFAANTPSYTPIIRGAAGFGMDESDWDTNCGPWTFYEVDSLGTGSGTGTLADAVSVGNRIIYFGTSGRIPYGVDTSLDIEEDCIIIAGETAPSPGIFIDGSRVQVRASYVYIGHVSITAQAWSTWALTDAGGKALGIVPQPGETISHVVIRNVHVSFAGDDNIAFSSRQITDSSVYQSVSAWGLVDPNNNGSAQSRCMLLTQLKATQRISIQRSVLANCRFRMPLVAEAGGSILDNVMYNWATSAAFRNKNIAQSQEANFEGNLFIVGPDLSNNEALRIKPADAGEHPTFWDVSGAGMNRGHNGMPDPPNENLDTGVTYASTRFTGQYPTGYTINGAGTTNAEEQEFATNVVDCMGPRPNDRQTLTQMIDDDVLSFGTGGEHIDAPSEIGWPFAIAENTDAHGDLPADPNAAGSPLNAGMEWVQDHSDALMPSGRGCN